MMDKERERILHELAEMKAAGVPIQVMFDWLTEQIRALEIGGGE